MNVQILGLLLLAVVAWQVLKKKPAAKLPPPNGNGGGTGGQNGLNCTTLPVPQPNEYPTHIEYVRAYYTYQMCLVGCAQLVTGATPDEVYLRYLDQYNFCVNTPPGF